MSKACIFRRVHSKRNANLLPKKMARVCVLEVYRIKCKKAYFLTKVKAHNDQRRVHRKRKGQIMSLHKRQQSIGKQLTA